MGIFVYLAKVGEFNSGLNHFYAAFPERDGYAYECKRTGYTRNILFSKCPSIKDVGHFPLTYCLSPIPQVTVRLFFQNFCKMNFLFSKK